MLERGVEVDHTTLFRWIQHYAPEMEKRLRWYYKPTLGFSWQVDETYVKVKGKWCYLYRAIDKGGNTIDFYLSRTRNAKAAKRFLSINNFTQENYNEETITPWAYSHYNILCQCIEF